MIERRNPVACGEVTLGDQKPCGEATLHEFIDAVFKDQCGTPSTGGKDP